MKKRYLDWKINNYISTKIVVIRQIEEKEIRLKRIREI